jgi:uncharacterized protein (DUF433 family)
MASFDRITSNPNILNGQPAIRGMRLTVRRVIDAGRAEILRLHRSGMIRDEVLRTLESDLDFAGACGASGPIVKEEPSRVTIV